MRTKRDTAGKIGHHHIFWFMGVLIAVWLSACASSPTPDKFKGSGQEQLLDQLTLFTEAVESGRIDQAMRYLAPDERAKFEAAGGAGNSTLVRRLKAMRLSTLAERPGVELNRGGLEGIFAELPILLPPQKASASDSTNALPTPQNLP